MENEQNATRPSARTLPGADQLKSDADNLKSKAAEVTEQAKSKAAEVTEQAKTRGREQIATGKQAAADKVEKIAEALQQTTEGLQQGEQQTLAGYANELAATVRNVATNLRERSVEDLLTEAQTVARRNPTMFFLGSVAVGVVLARFLKASADQLHRSSENAASYDRRSTDQAWRAGPQAPKSDAFPAESADPTMESEPAAVAEAKGY
jgi:hypothetical protein